jgi:N-acylneuraminate cytidylyltransferase/CMP-N,N'-diacetyllegionaminic acid synthase
MTEHPMECLRLSGQSWTMLAKPTPGAVRRQDYDERFYFINGAVYAVRPAFLRAQRAFMQEGDATALYVMDAVRGIDIDDPEDLDLGEALLGHPRMGQRILSESKP